MRPGRVTICSDIFLSSGLASVLIVTEPNAPAGAIED
jgi:hypothetical protein